MNFWDRHNRNRFYRTEGKSGVAQSSLDVDYAPSGRRSRSAPLTRGRFVSRVTDADVYQLDIGAARHRRTIRQYEAIRREVVRLNAGRAARPRYASTPSVHMPRATGPALRRVLRSPAVRAYALALAARSPLRVVAAAVLEIALALLARHVAHVTGSLVPEQSSERPWPVPDPAGGWTLMAASYTSPKVPPNRVFMYNFVQGPASHSSLNAGGLNGQALGDGLPLAPERAPNANRRSVVIARKTNPSNPNSFSNLTEIYERPNGTYDVRSFSTHVVAPAPGPVALPDPLPATVAPPGAVVPPFTALPSPTAADGPYSPPWRRGRRPAKRFAPPPPGERERKANIRNRGFASVVLGAAERASEVGDAVGAGYMALPEWRREMIEAELGRAPTLLEQFRYVYRYNREMSLEVLAYNLIVNEMDDRIEAFLSGAGRRGVQMTGQFTGVERAIRSGMRHAPYGSNVGHPIREAVLGDMERVAGAEPGTLTGGGLERMLRERAILRADQITW